MLPPVVVVDGIGTIVDPPPLATSDVAVRGATASGIYNGSDFGANDAGACYLAAPLLVPPPNYFWQVPLFCALLPKLLLFVAVA